MSDDFNWGGEDAKNIVIEEQPPIALYTNPHGGIVIRMNGDCLQLYDQTVIVRPENLLTLIKALAREAGMGEVDVIRKLAESDFHEDFEVIESVPIKRLKDRTATERQRRRRANKPKRDRDTVTVTPPERDTDRDTGAQPSLRLVAGE